MDIFQVSWLEPIATGWTQGCLSTQQINQKQRKPASEISKLPGKQFDISAHSYLSKY